MEFTYYEILGVNKHASEEEIKAAYKTLAKKYHPDKHAGNPVYEEHFKKVNTAYQTLSNALKRQRYDLKLHYKSQPASTHVKSKQPKQTYRPMNKRTPPPDKKAGSKYALIFASGFGVFIIITLIFYYFMNDYMAKDHLQKGKEMEAKNKYTLALNHYTDAMEYDKSLTEAAIRRGDLRLRLFKDNKGAAADYSKALAEKEDRNVFFKRAKCYLKIKRYDESIHDLNKAILMAPNSDTLYYYRAEVNNFYLGKHEEAVKDYEKTISLNAKFSEALLGRALAKQALQSYEESIKDLSSVIQLNPEEGSYYYYRGYSKFLSKDTAGACNDWFQADKLAFPEARDTLSKYCQ